MNTLVKENPRENELNRPVIKGFKGLDGVVVFQLPYEHVASMSGVSVTSDDLSDFLCGMEASGVGSVKTRVHRDNFKAMDMLETVGFIPTDMRDYTKSWLVWRLELIHAN